MLVFGEKFFCKIPQKENSGKGRSYRTWVSFDALKQVEDIRKQADSAKIQHGNNNCQGCLLSNMSNVKMFHGLEFKR